MKEKTKPYITLVDREWKGKIWMSSWRSHKFLRKLTDEEAKTLDNIEEIIPDKIGKDIIRNNNGKIFCNYCGYAGGMYVKKFPWGKRVIVYKCPQCNIKEIKPY